jgi:predicted kinase
MGGLVVVIFGRMATGKTTLARALGQALGWPVIESDRVRKTLAGMAPTTRSAVGFGEGIYAAAFSTRTYAEMRRQAAEHLVASSSVIMDGSYKRAGERELVRQLAQEHGAEVLFVYCECPPAEARRRLGIRLTDPQAFSDGRVELLEAQAQDFDPLTPADRPLLRLDTNRELGVELAELKSFVESYL